MKRILLLTCMLWAVVDASALEPKSKRPIHVLMSRMDVIYLKIDKEFLGAEIEIYSAQGVKLLSQKIVHRKVLIDFYYENPGQYVIHIVKGDIQKEFNFTKDEPCPELDRVGESVKIVQGI